MKSAKSRIYPASSIAPDQYTATTDGASVDLKAFDASAVVITTGAFGGTTPTATAKVQESSDNLSWSDVPDAKLDGATGNASGFALAASSVRVIGYTGDRRYLRVAITAVGGTTPVIRAGASVTRTLPRAA